MARRFRWSDAADEFGAMTILLHWLVAVLALVLGLLMQCPGLLRPLVHSR